MDARGQIEGEAEGEAGAGPSKKRGKRRSRRTRTAHPGVKVLEVARRSSSEATSWVARFRDPDTGRSAQVSLDALGLTTAESRRTWAIRKAQALGQRRAALATGAPLKTETALGQAVDDYITSCRRELKPSTVAAYEDDAERFKAWASRAGVTLTEQLTPARLALYRDQLATGRRLTPAKGGRAGAKVSSEDRPAPLTVNTRLLHAKALLNHLRRLGRVPALSTDTIRDALRPVKVPKPLPVVLEPADLRQLLRAALRHDAQTFKVTRDENAAGLGWARTKAKAAKAKAAGADAGADDLSLPTGTTPRYEASAPFVLTVLLTGMREAEARGLPWSAVRHDADGGRGEIRLGVETKTRRARIVDLAPCPVLKRLLASMKLKAGDAAHLFGGAQPWSRARVEALRRRLTNEYGAPAGFTWQALRSTCQSYLVNAAGILGDAAPFKAAKRAGHSLAVSEKHYLGVLRGLDPQARDLETAMGIADLAELVARAASGERVQLPDEPKAGASPARG